MALPSRADSAKPVKAATRPTHVETDRRRRLPPAAAIVRPNILHAASPIRAPATFDSTSTADGYLPGTYRCTYSADAESTKLAATVMAAVASSPRERRRPCS